MTIKELKDFIKDLPDEMLVLWADYDLGGICDCDPDVQEIHEYEDNYSKVLDFRLYKSNTPGKSLKRSINALFMNNIE